jgi:RNA polymerase sigma-70 factor (ECF subfamily)
MTGTQLDALTARFEAERGRLRAVAYRMLGSWSEADDAVQEAWLRLCRADVAEIENLPGWLTTVVGRICLDLLRSRAARREQPLEWHVPDPVVVAADGADPEAQALLGDSVGLALMVVLDTLGPAERLAFVLHDMFAVPFEDIAAIVGHTPNTTAQLASRARAHVRPPGSLPAPGAGQRGRRGDRDAARRHGVDHGVHRAERGSRRDPRPRRPRPAGPADLSAGGFTCRPSCR